MGGQRGNTLVFALGAAGTWHLVGTLGQVLWQPRFAFGGASW